MSIQILARACAGHVTRFFYKITTLPKHDLRIISYLHTHALCLADFLAVPSLTDQME